MFLQKAALIMGTVLVATSAPSAIAGPKEDATAAIEQWAAAFNSSDVEKVVANYTSDATVHGTVSPELASGQSAVRAYFSTLPRTKFQVSLGESSASVLSGDAVVLAGFYEFSGTQPSSGSAFTSPARYTFVVVRRDGQWKIAHHHSSTRPKPPPQ
jgi:uncharacterized protein (TIGR02246 family)